MIGIASVSAQTTARQPHTILRSGLPPGLSVVDVAAADDETAFAFHAALAARWATTSVERTTRDTGQAGVRLRCYLDLRQPLNPPAPAAVPVWYPGPAWGRP
ncbi:DUF6207 family protein [Streptomyces flaveolus]|uniref:DUF6207 family protein n=1 Tax=Streptomyces flaveolus TaxID=67297 RepID=UPI0036C873B0